MVAFTVCDSKPFAWLNIVVAGFSKTQNERHESRNLISFHHYIKNQRCLSIISGHTSTKYELNYEASGNGVNYIFQ